VNVAAGAESEAAAQRVVVEFNEAINSRDLSALAGLMTDDHSFVDAEGNAVSGREAVLEAWRGFFDAFPDYRNVWAELRSKGDVFVATGHSVCATEPRLDGPAIWTATVRGDRVSVWRVYEDAAEERSRLGLDGR
jgi:uncharacterized protein (TIGR02246 family)